MQAEFGIHGLEGFARQQNRQILLANQNIHAHAGHRHAKGGAPRVGEKAAHRVQQGGHNAQRKQQAAQAQRQHHHRLREKHTFQAAARHQFSDALAHVFGLKACKQPATQLPRRERRVGEGNGDGNGDGGEHG